LIDEGIELAVQAAIEILRGDEKSYIKMKVLPLFNQHLVRRMSERGDDGNDLQTRFMALMAEIRDVPGVQTLVTEKGIVDVPEGELLVDIDDEEPDFDAGTEAAPA
jgi:hypothetical protein